jgi:hypothetical protein
MTIIRSQSIIAASMDDIDDAVDDGCELFASSRNLQLDQQQETAPIHNGNDQTLESAPATALYSIPTKEPRKFDEAVEQEGCRQIIEALTPQERDDMCDPNLPLRHFRADKGNIRKAIKRIKYAIQWRKELKVEEMLKAAHNPTTPQEAETRNMLMKEAETGKMHVRGYDKDGRAVMYLYQSRENTWHEENNVKNLVYSIERLIACSKNNNREKSVLVFDFLGWKMKHASSMALTKMTIHIVQECYVERIERIYFCNAPAVFRTFFNMVKVFLDPLTKNKVLFLTERDRDKVEEYFDLKTCEKCLFGTGDLSEYNVDDYFSVPLNVSFDERL